MRTILFGVENRTERERERERLIGKLYTHIAKVNALIQYSRNIALRAVFAPAIELRIIVIARTSLSLSSSLVLVHYCILQTTFTDTAASSLD